MNLKEARINAGLKQKELADMVGIDAPLLSKLENGFVLPTTELSNAFEKALASRFEGGEGVESINYSITGESPLKTKIQGYDLEELLEAFEGTSPDKPITRAELCLIWNMSDRAMRNRLEEIRQAGKWILTSNTKGYYLCTDPEDPNLKAFINKMNSRSRSISKTVKAMTANLPGQIYLDI